MDLNQINEQLKVMQQQIAIMQESVSNMLLSSNAPVKSEDCYVLSERDMYESTYSKEQDRQTKYYNVYDSDKYAKLAALQRQITYKLEQFAIAVNGNKKVDMTNTYQEKYVIYIAYIHNVTNQIHISSIILDRDSMEFDRQIFLKMDDRILESIRATIGPLVEDYFELRKQLGLF